MTEPKSIGDIVKESWHRGLEQAKVNDARTQRAKRLATERQLESQESRLMTMLQAITEGRNTASRDELATEVEVWRVLYNDYGKVGL